VVTELGDNVPWDRATVYRNLVALVGIQLARVASHAGGICRYEIANDAEHGHTHPHFLCGDCGVVSCLPDTEVVTPKKAKWSKSLRAAEVQFVGRCPSCADA
jgi:Fur family ferric uptake transcriptional regulator